MASISHAIGVDSEAVTIRAIQAHCFRAPLSSPVITSFGRMVSRPALFVSIDDADGHRGWGEVWCNFPSVGAEHRARIVAEIAAPMLEGLRAATPQDVFQTLTHRLHILALQSGEPGPFAHVVAGLDTALWDLFARRANMPLWRMLGGTSPQMRVYASGINPTHAEATAERALAGGHRALKLKIGFDPADDRANLTALRRLAGDLPLAADVNQAWTVADAPALAAALDPFALAWLEEPVPADVPWAQWRDITRARTPLAGGENISTLPGFNEALGEGVLSIVQPDLAKWGGLSMGIVVARNILAAHRRFCPHYLGGGIGLLASAHLLAAAGGNGMLEVDINPNPLREFCCGPVGTVIDGTITLSDAPGLGIDPDLASLERFRVQ